MFRAFLLLSLLIPAMPAQAADICKETSFVVEAALGFRDIYDLSVQVKPVRGSMGHLCVLFSRQSNVPGNRTRCLGAEPDGDHVVHGRDQDLAFPTHFAHTVLHTGYPRLKVEFASIVLDLSRVLQIDPQTVIVRFMTKSKNRILKLFFILR